MFDIITSILASLGGLGVFLLMLAENVFPPIPSEVILPLAGYTAAQGRGSLWVVAIAGTLGSAAGAVLWYYVGRWIGIDRLKRFASRHGRWLTLTPGEVDHVDRWFDRYGRWAVLFGRMVPGVRTLISVPAGVSGMPLGPFLVSTLAGSAIWTVILVLAGYELGERYSQVASVIEPVSNAVLALAVGLVLFAMRDSIVFFYTPTEVAEKQVATGTRFRLGGLVEEGSIVRGEGTTVKFVVTDRGKQLPVTFTGVLPDLFREGQGVVAEGALQADGVFRADSVLAKHDENYMPPEVADKLKKQGVWRGADAK